MTRTTADRWAIAAACACALMAAPSLAIAQECVIVDADMGVMNDDAVALFMLLNSPNVEVLSVTIVPGNSWMEHGTAPGLPRHIRAAAPRLLPIARPRARHRLPDVEAVRRARSGHRPDGLLGSVPWT